MSEPPSLYPALHHISFFQNLSPDHLKDLAAAGHLKSFAAGDWLVRQGEAANELYVILEGQVAIYGQSTPGVEVHLAELNAGAFFGEQALVEGGSRSASVKALSPVKVFALTSDVFFEQLSSAPKLLSQVIGAINQKIRLANQHVFEEQLHQQQLLLQMQRQQQQLLAQMVNGVIGEMRGPLEQLQTLEQSLDEQLQPFPANLQEWREELSLQTSRVGVLVHALETLSPSEIYTSAEEVAWSSYWEELSKTYQMSSFQPLNLHIHLSPIITSQNWHGTPRLLTEIMMHLLVNAEQHAYPKGSGPLTIEMDYLPESQQFVLQVRDQGQGISPVHLHEVCSPFFSTQRASGSVGLGLAVVDNLVRNGLGGQLKIESQMGKGTQIDIRFPQR